MKAMKRPSKTRTQTASSVRQSVTIPAKLAIEVGRVARKNHLTMSRALVVLAQRGVEAEASARARSIRDGDAAIDIHAPTQPRFALIAARCKLRYARQRKGEWRTSRNSSRLFFA